MNTLITAWAKSLWAEAKAYATDPVNRRALIIGAVCGFLLKACVL